MLDLNLAVQFLAGAALALFLTPACRRIGLSERVAKFCSLAAWVVFGVGMVLSIGATVQWFLQLLPGGWRAISDRSGGVEPSFCSPMGRMVLQERIELSTSPLPRECSTTELLQQHLCLWLVP